MSLLADLLTTLSDRRYVPFARAGREDVAIEALCDELLTSRGEATGGALTRQVLDRYAGLDAAGRLAFFRHLVGALDIDTGAVRAALDAYAADPSVETYRALGAVSEPRRQELIRRLNQVPGATGRLVAMRADLLALRAEAPELGILDIDFRHLFASWFNRGFLVLRPINWESPAAILEKIIAYEAVHAINSWKELRARLEPPDRRCFAFFHPAMPDEPLIFVEVALTEGVAGSVQSLLAEERKVLAAAEADTAVFYSISNCQAGLAGISFGNSLIKQVVADLSRELGNLRSFVTLSPIPTLRAWLTETGQDATDDPERLRALAARYLTEIRDARDRPRDPVARFHLSNGALVHDVHGAADLSPRGLSQSGGAMVNYLYDPARISQNHEEFAARRQVAASAKVRGLARQAVKGAGRAESKDKT
jgi:malonyl-CoA decarboxylase